MNFYSCLLGSTDSEAIYSMHGSIHFENIIYIFDSAFGLEQSSRILSFQFRTLSIVVAELRS